MARDVTIGVERASDIGNPTRRRRVALKPENPAAIDAVVPGTLADEIGIQAGDRLLTVNGHSLRDVLDFRFYADVEEVVLEVERDGEITEYEVERDLDEAWGIEFADPTFDGIHVCENSCPFCFIKQIPKGMRRSLYVMDDDYRYSMLYGSFVTLTNLTEDDWQRIEEQRLGPLYVSVHATNPELRAALVGSPKGALIMEHLARLESIGIDYHTQLVLNPGINDGPELERSIRELAARGPRLRSIAAVPVGLTKFGMERQSKRVRSSRVCMRTLPNADLEVRRYRPEEALEVIAQAEVWQERFRRERGETFFYLGDEFYLMTGSPIPPTGYYDEFGQVEDGIGITRLFLDDVENIVKDGRRPELAGRGGIIACGTLIGDTMERAVRDVNSATGVKLEAVPLENTFFGPEITISGLMTGNELVQAFADRPGSEPIFISETMISRRTHTLMDDMHLQDIKSALGRDVIPAEHLSDVLDVLAGTRTAAA
jgi:putative radical SAM enzyme (TIGR03279 family)